MAWRDWFRGGVEAQGDEADGYAPSARDASDLLEAKFSAREGGIVRDGFTTLGDIGGGAGAEARAGEFTLNSPQAVAFFTGRDVIDGARIVSTEVAWRDSMWVRKCIMHTANPISKLTWELYNGTSLVKSHPVYDLLANPNPYFTTTYLWAMTVAILQLYGECFWWLVRDNILAPARRIEFFNPRVVTPIIDKSRLELLGYRVMMPGGGSAVIDKNDMVHFKHPNPFNRWRGSAPLESVALSVSSDLAQQRYNIGFFQRGAIPNGVLVSEKPLSPTQVKDVRAQFEGTHRDSHKVGILHGGLDWKETQQNARDMEFVSGRKFNREEILAAFGVPPVEVGLLEYATYNNLREQTKVFWLKTLMPICGIVCDGIDKDLVRDDSLHSEFDTDHVEELREALKEKMEVADKLWAKGMPWQKIDKFLDIGTGRFEGDDRGFVAFNLVPIMPAIDAAENPPEPAPAPAPGAPPDESGKTPKKGEPTAEAQAKAYRAVSYLMSLGWGGADARNKVSAAYAGLGEQGVDLLIDTIGPALRNEAVKRAKDTDGTVDWSRVSELLSVFEARAQEATELLGTEGRTPKEQELRAAIEAAIGPAQRDIVSAAQMAEIDRIIEEFKRKLADSSGVYYKQAASVGIEQMAELLGIDFDLVNPKIAEFIADKVILITGIEDTTKEKIRDLIESGLQEGLSVAEIADTLREDYNFGPDRAETIARTEMASTVNGARYIVEKEEGVEKHEWLSARDPRVRETHAQADGTIVEIGLPFPPTGVRFPGEPDGPPEEVINCRCITLPADDQSQNGFNASLRCTCSDPAQCATSDTCRRNQFWQRQVHGYAHIEQRFASALSKHFFKERSAILKVLLSNK